MFQLDHFSIFYSPNELILNVLIDHHTSNLQYLRWTPSNSLISCIKYGLHTWVQYSKRGLTRLLYNAITVSSDLSAKFRQPGFDLPCRARDLRGHVQTLISPARPVLFVRSPPMPGHYIFDLSVRSCVRACVRTYWRRVLRRESKNKTLNSCSQLPQIYTEFQNSFTGRLSVEFATNLYLNTVSHHMLTTCMSLL